MADHDGLMLSAVEVCIKSSEDSNNAKQYIDQFIEFIGWYFQELHDFSIEKAL
jgi:hypothetical protein